MGKVVMGAEALDGYLTEDDVNNLHEMNELYTKAMNCFSILETEKGEKKTKANSEIIKLYNEMGQLMQDICKDIPQLKIYSFDTEHENHAEASRVIAKLRSVKTEHSEFLYYTQRSFEMLFKLAYKGQQNDKKNYLVVKTPVTNPVQNYAVHKISDIDYKIENAVMCVMLRGALLPSMILSKEIEEYSSHGYVTPFALFKIKRDDSKKESDMQYILDLDKSYFNLNDLDGKDLIFADPMNATGGSLVTVVKHLRKLGVRPKSISCFHVISALKGALRIVRALDNCTLYTLWMDPVLNGDAYIMPGLGDAGDRINGKDTSEYPRNIIQLLADYGSNISGLYRSQLRQIEKTVLGN
ncbi:uracil phosphoribosyltransferase [Treponema pedis]|uniref:Phosphoribosyl transferase n=2 Tax=Treponema pedis TaxID=409322 RepID=S6A0T5_9SPIR|nr:uracil phosphoribosyltransferase [Treponema pedis]AGT44358.1 phosphoribosyl transferase [Treponema pedis str. T A4]QOW59671.1 uracil phosphoribosyltransferase [Treponema pedis]